MPSLELSPTVYGIETEYTCSVTYPNDDVGDIVGSCHSKDMALELGTEPPVGSLSNKDNNEFAVALHSMGINVGNIGLLSNGGRFYVDIEGPEYCTPEFRTAEEATHGTFDGDRVMIGLFETLRKSGFIDNYQLNRRAVDHLRNSRGIHINTTTSLSNEELALYIPKLATLNAVKGAMFGSGGLLVDKDGLTSFHHSPRLSITNILASNKFNDRPLVRYPSKEDGPRDGPYRRLESVSVDALNFAWPLRASMVLTNAVTTIMELGPEYAQHLPRLRKPVKTARQVGQYGNTNEVSIYGETEFIAIRPSQIIGRICTIILNADAKEGHLDPESKQVIQEILDVADRMIEDPLSVATQVESIARWIAISKKMETAKVEIDSEKICRFDFYWDWLNGGVAEGLRQSNKAGWHGFTESYSRSTTVNRMLKPPQDTRAKIRGDLIKAGDPESLVREWGHIGPTTKIRDCYVAPLQTEL